MLRIDSLLEKGPALGSKGTESLLVFSDPRGRNGDWRWQLGSHATARDRQNMNYELSVFRARMMFGSFESLHQFTWTIKFGINRRRSCQTRLKCSSLPVHQMEETKKMTDLPKRQNDISHTFATLLQCKPCGNFSSSFRPSLC